MFFPPIPPALEHLAARPFSFYPPIVNIEHNEWRFRKATWSEILVVNCKSGEEIWIPRRFWDELPRVNDPVLIVGLTKELEYRAGAVWPYQRRVIPMPVAVGGSAAPAPVRAEHREPAPVVAIRLAPGRKQRNLVIAGGGMALGAAVLLSILGITRSGDFRQRPPELRVNDEQYRSLSSGDDYLRILEKLGAPASDHWSGQDGERQFRALRYPRRRYTVILMGGRRDTATYIGTMDDLWHPLHAVELRAGGSSFPLLRALRRF